VKVILLERVKGLGEAGDVVDVAPGHARNYLVPRGLAEEATEANLARLQARLAQRARQAQRELEAARAAAGQLAEREIVVRAKAGESGRLFGSVTAADIAEAIRSQCGVAVDRRRIGLDEPIKALGSRPVTVRLHPEVSVQVTVRVDPA
jgi:large subunit ribosomal protein L9